MSLLLAIAQATEVVADVVKRAGGSVAKRTRKILVERVEELVEEFAEEIRQEPKVRAKVKRANKIKPAVVAETQDNARAWEAYYLALIDAIRDRQKAQDLSASISQTMAMLVSMIERKRRKDEEEALIAILMTL